MKDICCGCKIKLRFQLQIMYIIRCNGRAHYSAYSCIYNYEGSWRCKMAGCAQHANGYALQFPCLWSELSCELSSRKVSLYIYWNSATWPEIIIYTHLQSVYRISIPRHPCTYWQGLQ